MNLARLLYPVRVLGPGNRIGLWLCGCNRACKGCSNPELWGKRPEYEITPKKVFALIQEIASLHIVDGFTISGGEPMDQTSDVAELIRLLKSVSDDILIYSGYTIEELKDRKEPDTDYILHEVAVIIDGEYVEDLNNDVILRGSSNQKIHILNSEYYDRYQHYFSETTNQIQNFVTTDGIVSVGIHHPSF